MLYMRLGSQSPSVSYFSAGFSLNPRRFGSCGSSAGPWSSFKQCTLMPESMYLCYMAAIRQARPPKQHWSHFILVRFLYS